jgi:uncharacterized protein (DUF3820 family)
MKMPFGKFRGVEVADLPLDYLEWLRKLGDLRVRLSEDVRKMAEEILASGYRKVAALHHPDRGGEGKTMTLVNLAAEWLRQRLREEK